MKFPAHGPRSPQVPQIRAGEGSEGGHWYVPGPPVQCAYEVLGVNGKWRGTHIGDARKHGWFPGASSIVRQEAAPALERWKIRQAVMSALTHPKVAETKDADELMALIERDSQEQVKQAASRGTAIHAAIEQFFIDGSINFTYEPYIKAVRHELKMLSGVDDRDAWKPEVAVCHPFGFGGRIDLVSESLGWTIDFKGKEFAQDDEIKAYPEQCRQLAAYREAKHPTSRTANIFISRNHPGLVRTREWDLSESAKGWREFRLLLTYWQLKNNFPIRTELAA